ncbi:MAG: nitroreductase family protein [Pseudomonadota bacterium]
METSSIRDLIISNRSCRRFDQSHAVDLETLRGLVDLARMSASAANLQPLKYILSAAPDKNQEIFACLGWAAYLKTWDGPGPGEQPAGYIVILGDKTITENFRCDHGIAAQSILLGARAAGLGGCMLAAINHKRLREALAIPEHLDILLVVALGKPFETIVLESLPADGNIRYWRDDNGTHHVPKRSLDDIIAASW